MFEWFLCFWLLWLLFIIITFFMNNSSKRYCLGCWTLSVIWLSDYYVYLGTIQLSVALIMILTGAIIYYVETPLSFPKLLQAFTIMIGFSGLLMWAKLAPIWFFMPGYVLIPLLLVIFLIPIQRAKFDQALSTLLLGMTLGQLIFDLIVNAYYLSDVIGDTDHLLYVCFAVLLLLLLQTIFTTLKHVSSFIQEKMV